MTSIEVHDLMLRRKAGFVLGPLSLGIASGSRTALVGPSGCGKTTLLRCLAGLETPEAGVIRFGDRVVFERKNAVPPSARRIGFVFQDAALWPHLTSVEHLRFVAPELSRTDALELLAKVGLESKVDRRPGGLSGGEGQRLALARALAGSPEVLMLDEPLHSVDVTLRDELSLLIRRLCEDRGLTLLVVTHDRDEALAMADELVILRDGRLVESGAATEILRRPQTAFGAAMLCGAACLPATRRSDGALDTAFGVLRDASRGSVQPESHAEVQLVLLPGDVAVASDGNGHPCGRVLSVVPTADGALATVEFAGHTLRVRCDIETTPSRSLPLAIRGAPRFLPAERDS